MLHSKSYFIREDGRESSNLPTSIFTNGAPFTVQCGKHSTLRDLRHTMCSIMQPLVVWEARVKRIASGFSYSSNIQPLLSIKSWTNPRLVYGELEGPSGMISPYLPRKRGSRKLLEPKVRPIRRCTCSLRLLNSLQSKSSKSTKKTV